MDYSSRRVVVSERALLKEGATAKLPVGEVKEVVVTSLSDFGAFVEVCDGQGEASGLEDWCTSRRFLGIKLVIRETPSRWGNENSSRF